MTPGAAVKEYLKADVGIMALVGGVSPISVPQGVDLVSKSWVCYRWITGSNPGTHDGTSKLNLGARLEITVWDSDSDRASRVSYLIRGKLATFRGTMGIGGVKMACVGMVGPRQFQNPTGHFAVQTDFLMNVDESTVS